MKTIICFLNKDDKEFENIINQVDKETNMLITKIYSDDIEEVKNFEITHFPSVIIMVDEVKITFTSIKTKEVLFNIIDNIK